MKNVLYLLSLLLFIPSCSIYHSRPVSLEEAVEARNRVKVTTENNASYKFRELQMEDGRLLGVAHQNSNTARKVSGLSVERKGKFLYVELPEKEIKNLRLKNNTLSILVSILIPLAAITIPILVLVASGPGMP